MQSYKKITISVMIFCLTFVNFQNYYAEEFNVQKELKQNKKNDKNIPSSSLFGNYYNSHDDEENYNYLIQKEANSWSYKSPWLAFFLSYVFPGGGQWYNGDHTKALVMEGIVTVGLGLVMLGAMSTNYDSESNPRYIGVLLYSGLAIGGSAWLWSLIDAPIAANNINDRNRQISLINKPIFEKNNYKINFSVIRNKSKYCVGFSMNYGL